MSSKLTDELIDQVCLVVARGNFRKTAFQMHGISKNTWKNWMRIGRAHIEGIDLKMTATRCGNSSPFVGSKEHVKRCARLVERLDMTEAAVEDSIVHDIITGDNKDKRWYLEHRHSDKFSKQTPTKWDDEEAERVKLDPIAILAEKLQSLVNEPGPEDE